MRRTKDYKGSKQGQDVFKQILTFFGCLLYKNLERVEKNGAQSQWVFPVRAK